MNKISKYTAMLSLVIGLGASAFAGSTSARLYVEQYKGRTDIPAPVLAVSPTYNSPFDASAKVMFSVDASGRVTEIEVLNATDNEFSFRVLDAISRWKFTPALDANGVAVARRVTLPFIYNADETTVGYGLFASL